MEGVPYGACEPAEPPAVDPPPRRLLRRSWLWRASLLCTLAVSASALGRRALGVARLQAVVEDEEELVADRLVGAEGRRAAARLPRPREGLELLEGAAEVATRGRHLHAPPDEVADDAVVAHKRRPQSFLFCFFLPATHCCKRR